ncbi:hypothetical protein LGL08_20210 [Clostridium estertheticum]|uniref:hypothetical protein n=1 Tax=Clostridium estertheticum TaxID=238834 RepID=UPI001CF187C8|nr:hypothetical protein [Clostridium estertheticum]MCB2309030.1 hypothetical protein [Clostridium estertheticum]MCB2346836.1 hypothetical protein [Clostridium estertheticum]MCB2351852.1 hypothetical protein [Clostridium estertheticum]WAG48455.1 hypothetical protein LL127_23015 [Clostridium estertheticum]
MGNSKNMKFGGILDSINNKSNPINKDASKDIDKNDSNNNIINNDDNISNDNIRNIDRNVSNSNNGNNIGNIVIKKPVTSDKPKRVSYYLKEKTITDIKKLAKKSDMDISEFLQYLLDITLDKIEIE